MQQSMDFVLDIIGLRKMKQKKDEKQVKIKPIIKELIEGQCFICNTKCESYVHPDCAIAYTDYKEYLVML